MRRASANGFTLVEVLVALMVMAIMAVMAWQGVDGIVRARDANQDRLERSLRLNTVVSQWEQDLAALQETGVVPAALSFDGSVVRLTRRTTGGLQLVVWSLRPDDAGNAGGAAGSNTGGNAGGNTGGNTWRRWAGPAVTTSAALQENWLRSQQFQGNEPGQLRALSGVAQWQIYFFVGNAWSNAQSTGNVVAPAADASAPPREALPSGVRLVLSFAPDSGYSGGVIRDTLLSP